MARKHKHYQGWLDPNNNVESKLIGFIEQWKQSQREAFGFRVTNKDFIVAAGLHMMENATGDEVPIYNTEPILKHQTMQTVEELRDVLSGFSSALRDLQNVQFSPSQQQTLDSVQYEIDRVGRSLASAFDDSEWDDE